MTDYSWSDLRFSCIIALILFIIFGVVGGLIFMLLWNNLAPLFWNAAPILTLWQSLGCMILLGIIGNFFKSKSK